MSLFPTIIADAGSTKVEWAVIDETGALSLRFVTPGINAIITPNIDILDIFRSVAEKISHMKEPNQIFYYGAGCATPQLCLKIETLLRSFWPHSQIEVGSDLVGAAKSLLGCKRGIACILGTGSNSALFNGEKVTMNVPPLGFILGDEGSGTALGKRLIKEIFKGFMPEELKNDFFQETGLSLQEIIERVYREKAPNKFIASLVPFIRKHIQHPFIYNMVIEEFGEFFRRNVALYPDSTEIPVSFTGSIAFYFESELRIAAEREGFKIGTITKNPMDGLIHHLTLNS